MTKVKIGIQKYSGFPINMENLLSIPVGTLVPVFCKPVLPGDKIWMNAISTVQLPPMATDFYGRVEMRLEAFYVPMISFYRGWEGFVNSLNPDSINPELFFSNKLPTIIGLNKMLDATHSVSGPGTLADYLGFKRANPGASLEVSALPFMAYHKVYDCFYRPSEVVKSAFFTSTAGAMSSVNPGSLPWMPFTPNVSFDRNSNVSTHYTMADGVDMLGLRQRFYDKDYFTNCTPSPVQGNDARVEVTTDAQTSISSFSVAELYAQNAIEQFKLRNHIIGKRYQDFVYANYGVNPTSACSHDPIFLGNQRFDIYNHSVYQSSENSNTTQNPFNSVAAKYSSPIGTNSDRLIKGFTAKDYGYLMVIASIVPQSYYGTGTSRYLTHLHPADFAIPLLEKMGDQTVYTTELASAPNTETKPFGYQQRYAEFKDWSLSEVHGLLRDGQSLDSFCLQRGFTVDTSLSISSDFLEIKQNALDDVTAVSADGSKYGAWCDLRFVGGKSSHLSDYNIPSLLTNEDTYNELVELNGSWF